MPDNPHMPVIDGELHVEGISLTEIAETYGTPCFVYSAAGIRASYRQLADAFAHLPSRICYAVKANSNLAVLRLLAAQGAGFDIVSGGELQRVLAAGGDPQHTIFSGVGKLPWEITDALKAGIGCFNVESESELELINQLACDLETQAPIAFRVNPDVDPQTHPYIATGLKENKFGVPIEDAPRLYARAAQMPGIRISGVGAHIGSQIASIEPFLDSLAALLKLVDELSEAGHSLEHIDLGGGLGIRYRDEQTPDAAEYGAAVAQSLGHRPLHVMLEPGRSIVGNHGVLVTRVSTLKGNGEKNFAVVDAAMNDLIRPALYQAWHDVTHVTQPNAQEGSIAQWDLVGPVCESGDFLALDRALQLNEGDLLAFHSAGAYSAVMSSNYNSRGRAPEILIDGEQIIVARRRETIADQLALEMPLSPPR